jgi:excisionase family DNA binding protein
MGMGELTIKTNDLVTFTEAARLLNVSRPTIYNLVYKEQLHPVLIGRNRYLLRTEIEGLIDGQTTETDS